VKKHFGAALAGIVAMSCSGTLAMSYSRTGGYFFGGIELDLSYDLESTRGNECVLFDGDRTSARRGGGARRSHESVLDLFESEPTSRDEYILSDGDRTYARRGGGAKREPESVLDLFNELDATSGNECALSDLRAPATSSRINPSEAGSRGKIEKPAKRRAKRAASAKGTDLPVAPIKSPIAGLPVAPIRAARL
jgi:hypothetical protein